MHCKTWLGMSEVFFIIPFLWGLTFRLREKFLKRRGILQKYRDMVESGTSLRNRAVRQERKAIYDELYLVQEQIAQLIQSGKRGTA